MMKSRPASKREFESTPKTSLFSADWKSVKFYVNKTDYYTEEDDIVTYHFEDSFHSPLTLNELARWIQSIPLEERDCEVWSFQGLDADGVAAFFMPSLERAWENAEGSIMQFDVAEPDTDTPKIVYVL